MSDASDFAAALIELKRLVQPDLEPALTYGNGTYDANKELDQILENTKRARTFATAAAYLYGQIVMPTTRNGRRYIVTVPGTSGTEPTWSTGYQSSVSSGANDPVLTFEEAGPEYSNVYDIRRAAFDAWNLKVAKAVSKNRYISNGGGTANDYLYLNCVRERDKYVSIGVA